jgi:penicillin G amidase
VVSTRLLRLINVSIAVLALLVLILIYWFAFRPLPKVSGTLSAPVSWGATVSRDRLGVPHIEAHESDDAMFLQGFVTAQDRLWQMDGLRRFAAGELSEVAGPGTLEIDKQSRRLRMRSIAEVQYSRLKPQDRAAFIQFARGVNFFIDSHRGDYSLEYSIPGHSYSPRHWGPIDSLLVGLAMYRDLTDSSEAEMAKGRLLKTAPRDRVETLFPHISGDSLSPGSNAWAVSGAHTASGKPMLANDPHLAIRMPSIWYMVHLKTADLDVSGVSLAGVPGVIIGHNRNISWGLTNLEADFMDVYAERMDLKTGRYLFGGQQQQARMDHQMIGVYGSEPVPIDIWVTRHGPVVFSEGGLNYSVKWTAAEGFGFPFLAIDHARNWEEFRAAVSTYWGPPQNFVYADRQGNVGYQASGGMPIRNGFTGDVPLDGASGEQEWAGYVGFANLPSIYNPASGIVATANQNPFPADVTFGLSGAFADRYRIDQILDRLRAKQKLSVDDMLAIQKDVYSAYHHFLAGQAVNAVQHKAASEAGLKEAINVLQTWNGQMDKDEAAPFLTELLHYEMGRSLVARLGVLSPTPQAGAKGLTYQLKVTGPPARFPRPQVLETLVRTRPSGWVPKDDWDAWLIDCLKVALEVGRIRQGSPVSSWRWGKAQTWKVVNPVGGQLSVVDRFFNLGPVPMSGGATTVKQTGANFGPSMRMVVDWGNLDRSVQNLTAGESGFVGSSHYKDQWDAYYVGASFPMQFEKVEAKDVLKIIPSP